MTQSDLLTLTSIAEDAAQRAGAALAERQYSWLSVDQVTRRDIKLSADRAAEKIIFDCLSLTGIPMSMEEAGLLGSFLEGGSRQWIVDPLDGTVNYARGIPVCAVSIALLENGWPILGVVYDVFREELFSGSSAKGTTLNKHPIHVSDTVARSESVLATGLPPAGDFSSSAMEHFGRRCADWHKIRIFGSAALSLAYVAAGRVDAYREDMIMAWDVAAGTALVEAAGGQVQCHGAFARDPIDLRAANSHLLEEMGAP